MTYLVPYSLFYSIGFLFITSIVKKTDATIQFKTENGTCFMEDRMSAFGYAIPMEGMQGYVVVSIPLDGCSSINEPPHMHIPLTGAYFALIKRGACNFDQKVFNAQKAGYVAAIVYNIGSDALETMSAASLGGHINIPSLFIGETDANTLTLYNYTTDHVIQLTPDYIIPLTYYLIPFAIIVGICFVLSLIFMLVKMIKDRRYNMRVRLSKSLLKKIPLRKYRKGEDSETCAICLDDYTSGDKLRILPCEHDYHSKCIDPWLTKNKRVCPLCKRKVFPGEEDTSSDDDIAPVPSEYSRLLPDHSPSVSMTGYTTTGANRNDGANQNHGFTSSSACSDSDDSVSLASTYAINV